MGERKLKFQDRWMFNRVLCEEEVCRKVLRAAQSEVADRILSTLTPEEVESLNVLTEKIIHQCKDMGVRGERKHGRHHRHGKGRSCRK